MPVRKVSDNPDCYQWSNQKIYCGKGAKRKAEKQGQAIYSTGWKEAEDETKMIPIEDIEIGSIFFFPNGDKYVLNEREIDGERVKVLFNPFHHLKAISDIQGEIKLGTKFLVSSPRKELLKERFGFGAETFSAEKVKKEILEDDAQRLDMKFIYKNRIGKLSWSDNEEGKGGVLSFGDNPFKKTGAGMSRLPHTQTIDSATSKLAAKKMFKLSLDRKCHTCKEPIYKKDIGSCDWCEDEMGPSKFDDTYFYEDDWFKRLSPTKQDEYIHDLSNKNPYCRDCLYYYGGLGDNYPNKYDRESANYWLGNAVCETHWAEIVADGGLSKDTKRYSLYEIENISPRERMMKKRFGFGAEEIKYKEGDKVRIIKNNDFRVGEIVTVLFQDEEYIPEEERFSGYYMVENEDTGKRGAISPNSIEAVSDDEDEYYVGEEIYKVGDFVELGGIWGRGIGTISRIQYNTAIISYANLPVPIVRNFVDDEGYILVKKVNPRLRRMKNRFGFGAEVNYQEELPKKITLNRGDWDKVIQGREVDDYFHQVLEDLWMSMDFSEYPFKSSEQFDEFGWNVYGNFMVLVWKCRRIRYNERKDEWIVDYRRDGYYDGIIKLLGDGKFEVLHETFENYPESGKMAGAKDNLLAKLRKVRVPCIEYNPREKRLRNRFNINLPLQIITEYVQKDKKLYLYAGYEGQLDYIGNVTDDWGFSWDSSHYTEVKRKYPSLYNFLSSDYNNITQEKIDAFNKNPNQWLEIKSAETFEAAEWAGYCPQCKKWRTKQMSKKATPEIMKYKSKSLDEKHRGKLLCGMRDRGGLIQVWPMSPDYYGNFDVHMICGMPLTKVKKKAETFEAKGENKEHWTHHECIYCDYKTEPKWLRLSKDKRCPKCAVNREFSEKNKYMIPVKNRRMSLFSPQAKRRFHHSLYMKFIFTEEEIEAEWERWKDRFRNKTGYEKLDWEEIDKNKEFRAESSKPHSVLVVGGIIAGLIGLNKLFSNK